MKIEQTDVADVLTRARDADQRAEYHTAKALEWTHRAWRLRQEVRRQLAKVKGPG